MLESNKLFFISIRALRPAVGENVVFLIRPETAVKALGPLSIVPYLARLLACLWIFGDAARWLFDSDG